MGLEVALNRERAGLEGRRVLTGWCELLRSSRSVETMRVEFVAKVRDFVWAWTGEYGGGLMVFDVNGRKRGSGESRGGNLELVPVAGQTDRRYMPRSWVIVELRSVKERAPTKDDIDMLRE